MTATPRELVFTAPVFPVRKGRRVFLSETPAPAPPPRARPLEVERLIALAHVLQARVDAGESPADLSRALGFTRARISQLLDLTLLAPDITWPLHFMTNAGGWDRVTERALRALWRIGGGGSSGGHSTTFSGPTTSERQEPAMTTPVVRPEPGALPTNAMARLGRTESDLCVSTRRRRHGHGRRFAQQFRPHLAPSFCEVSS